MFPEVHCRLIDPDSRRIDLDAIARKVPGWKSFGPWESCDEGVMCSAGWMACFSNHYHYHLSKYPGLIIEYLNGQRSKITWSGPPPKDDCVLL